MAKFAIRIRDMYFVEARTWLNENQFPISWIIEIKRSVICFAGNAATGTVGSAGAFFTLFELRSSILSAKSKVVQSNPR